MRTHAPTPVRSQAVARPRRAGSTPSARHLFDPELRLERAESLGHSVAGVPVAPLDGRPAERSPTRARSFQGPPAGSGSSTIRPVGSGVAPVIQRKIILYSSQKDEDGEREREANLNRLRGVLGDSGATLKRDGAEVKIDSHPKTPAGLEHPGYRLLKRMIEHGHGVHVGQVPGKGEGPSVSPLEAGEPKKKGIGGGSVLHLPIRMRATATTNRDRETGALVREDAPEHLQVGHELIHADRMQRGVYTGTTEESHRVQGDLEGYGPVDTRLTERSEELQTIGVKAADRENISENDLRDAARANRRVAHNTLEDHLVREHAEKAGRLTAENERVAHLHGQHQQQMLERRKLGEEARQNAESARAAEAHHRSRADGWTELAAQPHEDGTIMIGGQRVTVSPEQYEDMKKMHQGIAESELETAEQQAGNVKAWEAQSEDHRKWFEHHKEKALGFQGTHAKNLTEIQDHHAKYSSLKRTLGLA